jgi:hypothetical protein
MATDATLNFDRRMFEDIRPAFFSMTVDTTFPGCLLEHRLVSCAVWAMAVRAFHQSFGHTVVRRELELRLYGGMTGETEFRLRLSQQIRIEPAHFVLARDGNEEIPLGAQGTRLTRSVCGLRQVSRMTGLARHAVEMVLGSVKVLLI